MRRTVGPGANVPRLPPAVIGVAVVLAGNATLADMSCLLKAPVSALVKSNVI